MALLGSFADAFLQVLAIIGIILVGGFVIFFLGDLVLSILDPNYVRFSGKRKVQITKENKKEEEIKQIEAPHEKTEELDFKFNDEYIKEFSNENLNKNAVIEQGIGKDFFGDKKEEKKEEKKEVKEEDEDGLANLRAAEEEFRLNMLRDIEERRKKQSEQINQDAKYHFFDDDDIDVFEDEELGLDEEEQKDFSEILEKHLSKSRAEEGIVALHKQEEKEEVIEETDNKVTDEPKFDKQELEALRARFEAEIARLESEANAAKEETAKIISEANAAKEEAAKIVSENKLTQEENEKLIAEKETLQRLLEESKAPQKKKVIENLSLEEYETKLNALKERLAVNEKDLRNVKKEFIPLRKVNKTLERDEKKLRRREAIVAKQKVELYGVNNFVDIDENKAKKLAEDLDLLEGLRLSVKHCEDVMVANKDRYPILENTFNILTRNNQALKVDVQDIEERIAKIKSNNE
jgi:hypothetical protein